MSTRTEIRVSLECSDCSFNFEVSARYAREIRRGVYPQRCRDCRHDARCRPVQELGDWSKLAYGEVTDRERRWCLAHFTDEAILEIAELLSGRRGDIGAVRAWREQLAVPTPPALAA